MRTKNILFALTLVMAACNTEQKVEEKVTAKEDYLFEKVPVNISGVTFNNKITQDANLNILAYEYLFNGGGVAIGDVNNDKLPDLFFTGNQVPNRLYINKGDLKFEDVTEKSGVNFVGNAERPSWKTGATMADVNNDGLLDIYVCRSGMSKYHQQPNNLLYINNGNNTFTEKGKEFGVDDAASSSQATFFDYDKDGDLDLYVLNHFEYFNRRKTVQQVEGYLKANPDILKKNSSHLFENKNGKFVNVTEQRGMLQYGYGLGVVAADINEDGWTDLYVSQDYTQPNILWINDKKGGFKNATKEHLKHVAYFSMGCDVNDFNNDGKPDIVAVDMAAKDHVLSKTFMTSMRPDEFLYMTEYKKQIPQFMFNELQLNQGGGQFSEVAHMANIAKTEWSWAPLFADFDNDGWKDLLVTNGYKQNSLDNDFRNKLKQRKIELKGASIPMEERMYWLSQIPQYKSENYYFRNTGNFGFEDAGKEWLNNVPGISNGAAYADLDADGDLDLVLNNIDAYADILENRSEKNHYLQVAFESENNASAKVKNAKVWIYENGKVQYQELTASRGFQSAVEPILHFGLGEKSVLDSLVIQWANGKGAVIQNPEADQRIIITYEEHQNNILMVNKEVKTFKNVTKKLGVNYKHLNLKYNDFQSEILLPHKVSSNGPYIGVGDINNDGLDDFYVGGNRGQAGELYVQNSSGKFNLKWKSNPSYQDMESLFIDWDKDGNNDLYIVSGGGREMGEGAQGQYRDRLKINTGNGKLVNSKWLDDTVNLSGQIVRAIDYNGDGKGDLIVGGRVVPGKYPTTPKSYILENAGGYRNVTKDVFPDLENIGMVTDILVKDLNEDGVNDVVVCGEWMAIKFYENRQGVFEDATEKYLPNSPVGWWYSLSEFDVDGDGKKEIIAGNIGENNKFHPSKEKPLKLFYDDFDDSGTGDVVLSVNYQGKDVPVRGRECSSQQMPFIKDKFPTYNEFANADIEGIYGVEKVKGALQFQATEFAHIVIKDGEYKHLPKETQTAPFRAAAVFTIDGKEVLIGGGNFIDTEVETTAYDAGMGFVLSGSANGVVTKSSHEMGLTLDGDVRDIKQLTLANGKQLLLVSNFGGPLQMFTLD